DGPEPETPRASTSSAVNFTINLISLILLIGLQERTKQEKWSALAYVLMLSFKRITTRTL
ncbi:unnamed protein product, partial [Urochloa humidicola]